MMIPVVVESVRVNLASGQRVVILKDDKLERYLRPLPPPTETIFELLDRIEPTPEQLARTRARLDTAA